MLSPDDKDVIAASVRRALELLGSVEFIERSADEFVAQLRARGFKATPDKLKNLGQWDRKLLPDTFKQWVVLARLANLPPDDVLYQMREHLFRLEKAVRKRLENARTS